MIQLKTGETFALYVDVDGTLLLWPGPSAGSTGYAKKHGLRPLVNKPLVEAIRQWHKPERFLAIWSRGGVAASAEAARLTGLKPDALLPKPRIVIDDGPKSVTAGHGFVVLKPGDADGLL